jgi:mannose-6-phosphate isomerase
MYSEINVGHGGNGAETRTTPVVPLPEIARSVGRKQLFNCPRFRPWRLQGATPFRVGMEGSPHGLIGIEGVGNVACNGTNFGMSKGTVMLLPTAVGACTSGPEGHVVVLEIAIADRI